MSRRRNPARILAAAFLLAAAAALLLLLSSPAPGHAQTSDQLLLGNTGGTSTLGEINVGFSDAASQPFRTGKNPTGYTLTRIQLDVGAITGTDTAPSASTITVTLRADSSGDPADSALATFSFPDTWTPSALNEFTLATAHDLDPDKTYHIHFAATQAVWVQQSTASQVDAGSASGWSFSARERTNSDGDWEARTNALTMELHGTIKATAPGAPTGLTGTDGHHAVKLEWTAPADDGGSPITGYEYTTDSAGTFVATGSTGTSLILDNLADGVRPIRVRAVNAIGEGPEHEAVEFAIGPASMRIFGTLTFGSLVETFEGDDAKFTLIASKPVLSSSKPLNVSVSVSESGDMVASADEGAKTVSFALNETSAVLLVPTVDDGVAEDNSVVTAAIQTDADYTIDANVLFSSGMVTVADDESIPGPPTSLDDTEGHHAVRLDWVAPADPGSSPITGYQARLNGGGYTDFLFQAAGSTGTSYTTGVLFDGVYTLEVRAENASGYGPWSTAVTITIGPATVTIAGDGGVTEGADAAFTLTASKPVLSSDAPLNVSVSVSEPGNMVAPADEGAKTVDFAVGDSTAALSVPTVDDGGVEGNSVVTAMIQADTDYTVGASSSDTVTVADNDTGTAGVRPSPATLDAVEGEAAASYEIVLVLEPGEDVTVTPVSGDTGAATVSGALTFTPGNWNVAQTVTVTAVEDSDSVSERVTVSHTVSTASGGGYHGVSAPAVTVRVEDNDTPGITRSVAQLAINEGGAAGGYTLAPRAQPSGTVTVQLTSSDTGAATVSPPSLTFTVGNWDTPQDVTVTAVDDADAANEALEIRHDVSGADYEGVTVLPVAVTVVDDDTPNVNLSAASVDMDEGEQATWTVVLATPPTTTVTVRPTSDDPGAVTVRPSSLYFTTSNWDTPQTVTATALQDADGVAETVTVIHPASGGEYAAVTAPAVTVRVDDDETPTAPGMVENLRFNTSAERSLSFEWDPPANDGRAPVTNYRYSRGGGWVTTGSADIRSGSFTGLTNGSSYTVTVEAGNAVGWGPSASVRGTASTETPDPISGPTSDYTWDADVQRGRLDMIWMPPVNPGWGELTYRVEMASAPAAEGLGVNLDWRVRAAAHPGGHADPARCPIVWRLEGQSCVIYSLANAAVNTDYAFRVRPENTRNGPWQYAFVSLEDRGPQIVNDNPLGVDYRIETNTSGNRIYLIYTHPIRTVDTDGYRVHRSHQGGFGSHAEYANAVGFFVDSDGNGDFDWSGNLASYGEAPERVTRRGRTVTLWLDPPIDPMDDPYVAAVRGAVVGSNGLPSPALNPMGHVKNKVVRATPPAPVMKWRYANPPVGHGQLIHVQWSMPTWGSFPQSWAEEDGWEDHYGSPDGYEVEWSADRGTTWQAVDPPHEGVEKIYAHGGLTVEEDSTFHYRVRGVNGSGAGPWSNVLGPWPPPTQEQQAGEAWTEDLSTGLQPRDLAVDPTAAGNVLSWRAPWRSPEDVTGYQILRRRVDTGEQPWPIVEDTGNTGATWTDTGVEQGVLYFYQVKTVRGRELSRASNYVEVYAVAVAALPGAPGYPVAESPGAARIDLTWTAPAGDPPPLGYQVQWSADGESGWQAVDPPHAGTETAYADTGLSGGTTRHYRVRAITADGEGPWSAVVFATTEVPLTASFSADFSAHGGAGTTFVVRLTFSEAVAAGYRTLRDTAVRADQGEVRSVSRVNGSSAEWDITVAPASDQKVLVTLSPGEGACGESGVICTADGRKLSNSAAWLVLSPPQEAQAANSPPTGAPAVSGAAQVGETLTADTTGIADEDGLDNVAFSYQWQADDAEIAGATDATYTLTDSDVGKTITVQVTFTDDAGNEEELTSAATAAVEAKANTPATGAPAISGTAQVGVTLTADTSGIADADGLDNAVFTYQWLADGAETQDATDSTYTPVVDDEGKAVSVTVTFTDDAGNEEELTSAVTDAVKPETQEAQAANTPATGLPAITGIVRVGEKLTADLSGIADEDGLTNASFAYQWHADGADIPGATDSTYTLVADDEGKAVSVAVSFTDDAGNDEELTSAATAAVEARPNRPAMGALTITGTARVGELLTADVSSIKDDDGLDRAAFAYQWQADSTDLSGATGSSYTLAASDEGKAMSVTVSFTDYAGHEESFTSTATAAVVAATEEDEEPTDRPHGLTAEASDGAVVLTWTAPVVDYKVSSYHILRHRPEQGEAEPLVYVDQTLNDDTAYTDTEVEPGVLYVYRVKAIINVFGDLGEASDAAQIRAPATAQEQTANNPAMGAPTITGKAQVGETLTADVSGISDDDGLSNAVFSYQWQADGADISDATSDTYTLADADEGKAVSVKVTFTDDAGNEETLTSAATAAVEARPNSPATGAPTINGTAQVGETLTADTSAIADDDGLDNASFSYQWLADGAEISGTTGSTYTLVDADEGKAIVVKVSFTDDRGHKETLTSSATAAVGAKANSPATGAPAVTGTALVGETLTADTSGIADEDGLDSVSYGYQWISNDGSADSEIGGATGSTYILASDDMGKTIKVRVSFTDDRGHREELTSAATDAVEARPLPPLTASLENVATSHDGESAFTFELRFSEEFGISYKTLRDHAFTVTGGTVKKAKRLEQGSNVGWRITVRPDGNGQVVIVLPETTDCDAQGAICTEDGRKLSHRLELTVSGPGG